MLTYGGKNYSSDHLAPFQRRVLLPLPPPTAGFTKNALVEFRFSNHSYSRGPVIGEVIPQDLLVQDGPRARIFDLRRYNLSKLVEGCIDSLIAEDGDVGWSRHDNFFQTDIVQEEEDGTIREVQFYIFMRARVERVPQREKHLRVQIQSSYPDSPNLPSPDAVRIESFRRTLAHAWNTT